MRDLIEKKIMQIPFEFAVLGMVICSFALGVVTAYLVRL